MILKIHLFSKFLLRNAGWHNEPAEFDGCGYFDECNVIVVGVCLVPSVGEDRVHNMVSFSALIYQPVKFTWVQRKSKDVQRCFNEKS